LLAFFFVGIYLSIEYLLADICGIRICRTIKAKRQLWEKRIRNSALMKKSSALSAEMEALEREIKSAEENPVLD